MMTQKPLTVLWFKRDLRLYDHAPLVAAAKRGRILPLYVAEPDYWALPDTSYRQWKFLRGALAELQTDITKANGKLIIHKGNILDTLENIHAQHGTFHLTAHMETGNAWTYQRDNAVRDWCAANTIHFSEHQQYGIWRGADLNRDKWAKRWDMMMAAPLLDQPKNIQWVDHSTHDLPTSSDLQLAHDGITSLQKPGRKAGLQTLRSFLYERGAPYQKAMSSPITGESACSRLSPHLVAGSLSMKEIYQATLTRQAELADLSKTDRSTWPSAMKSFIGRLHWHCHFMQKLETEPEIEWLPMARVYAGLRQIPDSDEKLTAFTNGQTGFPFIDACMRYLRATGWINFRMRAMLMSFASYNLWLPWQQSGHVLARLFTDYEPGIHWSQSQMQSGETGMNTVRVYSPVKQGYDQDPDGIFTRTWVPEMGDRIGKALQEPWTSPTPPKNYPAPIVDHQQTARDAKSKIYTLRRTEAARAEAANIVEKHGSRKSRGRRKSA